LGARLANLLLAWVAVVVALVGHVEKLLSCGSTGGLPVNEVREASLAELERSAGKLSDKRLLPSAYEVWVGARSEGCLRLRYTYDAPKLRELLPAAHRATCACTPLRIDSETREWVRSHVQSPCPATRLQVWRALKVSIHHSARFQPRAA